MPAILVALGQNPGNIQQLLTTARVPVAPGITSEALADVVGGLLWDHMISTNNNREVLGGKPFNNRNSQLCRVRQRHAAEPVGAALRRRPERRCVEIAQHYQTTGVLTAPIVTLHTTGDHMIPYWHAGIYRLKTLLTGSGTRHVNIPISRYGHCSYQWKEVLYAFIVLVNRVNAQAGGPSAAPMAVVEIP